MKNKFFVFGVLALVFGFMFTGCAGLIKTNKRVETETSKMLMNAAKDLILAKDDGILPAAFQAAFEKQFPGLKITGSGWKNGGGTMEGASKSFPSIWISYQDKKYSMRFQGDMKGREEYGPADTWAHITNVTNCVEFQ